VEFKMHVIRNNPESPEFNPQFELEISSMISDFGGENP
jgi:TFIIF-interacting CTD phosphatase-like protein